MSSTHGSPEATAERRFRAATIDEALDAARSELGDVQIVEANRIRRGGVGGFFATDLGVEVVVRVPRMPAPGESSDELVDDEFVDTTDLWRESRPTTEVGDGVRARTARRPQFYDQVIEDSSDSITAELERLLAEATDGPRTARGPASFADHLERQMQLESRTHRPTAAAATTAAATTTTTATTTTEPERPVTLDAERPVAPISRPMGTVEVGDHRIRTWDPTTEVERIHPSEPVVRARRSSPAPAEPAAAVPAAAPAAVPEVPTAVPAAPRASAPRSRPDPWRRSIDLAAGAVGRLVEQLSDVTPEAGSKMTDLSRLVVKVTTPDGAVIELTAEIDGGR